MKKLVIAIGVLVALTRLLAAAHSLWEWDEALFSLGVRHFDVAAHHPHPPGFPLYILLGKLFRFFTSDEFHALRAVNVLSAMLIFPAMYVLARELRMDVVPAISAALLTCFAPNVWFYGGTAFSDIPTLAMLLFGAALLLRGRTSRSAYFAGCIVMACACVMRPQNVLLGAYPFLAASWPRWKERKRDPILGAALMFVIIAAFFGGAALLTGVDRYRAALQEHSAYVLSIDSYHNPGRLPWYRTYRQFLLDPYGAGRISAVIAVLAAIGLLRFRRASREALAIFLPFMLFSLFMLNPETGGRYAVTSIPLLMICCAEGMAWGEIVPAILTLAIVGKFVVWTLPALNEVRTHDAPTYAAMQWVRRNLDPKTTRIYVENMEPVADLMLHDYRHASADTTLPSEYAWLISDHPGGAATFSRPRGHLFAISRKRYFDVSVRPLASTVIFGDGWYGEESGGNEIWRWMGRKSSMQLPGKGELAMTFDVPLDVEPRKPVATLAMNGAVIDRFACDARVEKRWTIPAGGVLTIELDEAAPPGRDPRELGLRLRALSWRGLE